MKKTALITGGSSGIGFEIAKKFAADNYNLILVSLSEHELKTAKQDLQNEFKIEVKTVEQDLSKTESAKTLHENLKEENLHEITALVNNAGFGLFGDFLEIDSEKELAMLQLNMITLTQLTRLFLPELKKHKKAYVLNVASTAAFQPGPLMAAYYASKAYVLSLSEALAEELSDTSVTVTALCPGPTRSGFQKTASMEKSKIVQGDIMSPEEVAEYAYKSLMRGKRVAIPGLKNKVGAQMSRFVPRDLVTKIVHRIQSETK